MYVSYNDEKAQQETSYTLKIDTKHTVKWNTIYNNSWSVGDEDSISASFVARFYLRQDAISLNRT